MPFFDPIESTFYGHCVERLLMSPELAPLLAGGIVEIGPGTARPVVEALQRSGSRVPITGYELDAEAARMASRAAAGVELGNYTVVQGDFFAATAPGAPAVSARPARCAIGNPPYLPATVRPVGASHLWGGHDGAHVARRILSAEMDVVLLMIASISDPVGLVQHARAAGYRVADWLVRPIPFGRYSRLPWVSRRIGELARSGRAFFGPEGYLLAGVTWVRAGDPIAAADEPDHGATVLRRILTTAGSATGLDETAGVGRTTTVDGHRRTPILPGHRELPARPVSRLSGSDA
ncbi:methyltransferase [Frankia sp. AiPs1]|uniref:methyltransferase n=1 Tax=Frankia sp. AiPs1 TaxID=573493 RepID=UPI0020443CB3|nr:methyltransferase [Frankia sp. AiPs1]MCM3926225.1 methyltransferase [Frankia sp. AiPs1]